MRAGDIEANLLSTMADTMRVICSTENGVGSRDLVESPSLGCSLLLLSSLTLRTGGGFSVCDEPESSFERFERVVGGVVGPFRQRRRRTPLVNLL